MPDPRHLRNAPITEALIDFRVKVPAAFQAEQLAGLKRRLAGQFPKVDERRGIQVSMGFLRGEFQQPVLGKQALEGYFFKTADEKTIAQFRADGFTFNRLRPYTSWDELFPKAIELWKLYCAISTPEVVTRVAVRYINRIELPPGATNLEHYLRTVPVLPPELPQSVGSFLTRVTIHDAEADIFCHVSQVSEVRTAARQLSVILDIDTYKEKEIPIDDPAVEQTFGRLRTLKNLVFFNTLTEQALRLFE